MSKEIVSQSEIHSMNMGMKSTGFMMPDEITISDEMHHGVRCWKDEVDQLFGKLIPGQTLTVSGMPGAGKTTFLLKLLSFISDGAPEGTEVFEDEGVDMDEKAVAYISCEESIELLKMKADRIGVDNVALCNESCVETICDHIRNHDFDVVVIDSLQGLNSRLVEGERKVLLYAGNKIVQAANETKTIVFIVCHATVQGKIKGGTKLPHQVDTDLRINRASSHGPDARVIFTEKNRMGRTGEVYLNMFAFGYDFDNPAVPTDDGEESSDKTEGRELRKERDLSLLYSALENDTEFTFGDLSDLCKEHKLDIGRAERLLREMTDSGSVLKEGTRKHNFVWSLSDND